MYSNFFIRGFLQCFFGWTGNRFNRDGGIVYSAEASNCIIFLLQKIHLSDLSLISRRYLYRDIGPAVRVFANGPSHTKDFENGT